MTTTPKLIRRVAVVGTSVIGASSAALFLAKGLEVVAPDPAPGASMANLTFCPRTTEAGHG